jgi:hypothetical protein
MVSIDSIEKIEIGTLQQELAARLLSLNTQNVKRRVK